MTKPASKEEWSSYLIRRLYEARFIQTLWNTSDPAKKAAGWTLKNGSWSPWFFNLRPIGSRGGIFCEICQAMADLVLPLEFDFLIGVEMAGIGLTSGVSVASAYRHDRPLDHGYTRPLPEKARTPEDAARILREIDADPAGYGQKQYVEALLTQGARVVICDDMATDLGSKLIGRQIAHFEAKRQNVSITADQIVYFLNRDPKNVQKGIDFAKEANPELIPARLDVHYVMEFNQYLPELKQLMRPEEYETVVSYQEDSSSFQDRNVQKEVLVRAAGSSAK